MGGGAEPEPSSIRPLFGINDVLYPGLRPRQGVRREEVASTVDGATAVLTQARPRGVNSIEMKTKNAEALAQTGKTRF